MNLLARNFALLSLGEFASKICGFIAFAYLARVLGPREFGQLEFALALMFFLSLFVDCGLGSYGAREVARDESAVTHLTVRIMFARCLLAVVAFAILLFVVAFLNKPWPVQRLILLYGLTLFVQIGLLPWVFQGRDLMAYVALASAMRWLIFAAGVVILVANPVKIWIVPLVEVAALLCVVAYYWAMFQKRFGRLEIRSNFRHDFALLRCAWPIGASELVWALKMYFATVLLGFMIYGPEVGWFGAAHRLVMSLHAFVWLYFFNLLPSISRGTSGDGDTLQRLMRNSLQITGWVGVFVALLGTALAGPLLSTVYGAQYEPAVTVFQVLIWLIPLALVSGHFRYSLIAYDRQGLEFFTAACGAALNVILNLAFNASAGIIGAAVSLVIAEGVICGLSYLMVYKTIVHIPVGMYLWKPLIGAAVLAAVLQVMPPINIWIVGATTVILFFALLSVSHRTLFADLRSLLARCR